MPKVVERNLPKEGNPIISKVRKYVNLRSRIDDLTKEQSVLKTELAELVDNEGTPDEKGHIWYSLPEEVEGYKSLQRQSRRRLWRGTLASKNSIWSARMRRPRRIMSSCRLGT